MRAFLRKLRKDKKGNVLIIAGAGTLALVGGAGLGVDAVQWYLWKRELQNAVDAGALAGANAMFQGQSATTAATLELNRNEDTSITGLNIVGINTPPTSGAYTGDSTAVEVIATVTQSLPFSSIFISTPPTIRARAVATTVADGEHCIYSLSDSGVGIFIAGSTEIDLGCGVLSNSLDSPSIDFQGSTAKLYGTPISAAGGVTYDSSNVLAGTSVRPYVQQQPDPLDGQYSMSDLPATATCDKSGFNVSPSTTVTLDPTTATVPGYIKLCGNTRVQGRLNLKSGIYILDGGTFTVNASAHLKSNGFDGTIVDASTGAIANRGEPITIILTNGAKIDMAGGADVSMRAADVNDTTFNTNWPEWTGMLIFQDPSDPYSSSTLAGSSNSGLNGAIYMPNSNVTLTGNSSLTSDCLFLVTWTLTVSGDATIGNDCGEFVPTPDDSARIVRLVE